MKVKMTLLLVVLALCVSRGNAQQCSGPEMRLIYFNDYTPTCPMGGPNASPYIILGSSSQKQFHFDCIGTANAVSPPGPGGVYYTYDEPHPWTAYGQTYCNTNHAPYSSYECLPKSEGDVTTATSLSDYNRFYNRVSSFSAENGACPQTGFDQDFQQCVAIACVPPPPPPDPCCKCYVKGNDLTKPTVQKASSPCCDCSCPIIVDTSGNGFDLTSAANGVKFDMSGTTNPDQIAWTAPGSQDAFLCLPDSNGRCDDGKDLFGNFTPQPPTQTPNGFLALAVYDLPANGGNGDGIIDSRDAIFSRLRLWIDRNHDGISQPDELYTLPTLGVYSISLNYKEDRKVDQYGNLFRYRAQINPGGPPGSVSRTVYDVFLLLGSGTITAQRSCPAPQPPRLLPEGKDGRLH